MTELQMIKKGWRFQFGDRRVRLNSFGRPVRIIAERVDGEGNHLEYLGKYPISREGMSRALLTAKTGDRDAYLDLCSVCGEPAKYISGKEGRCHEHKRESQRE